MTRDDIIRLAREAGLLPDDSVFGYGAEVADLSRFAHLIEDHLRFDSIHSCGNDCQRPACVQGREQRARVYEECAQICEAGINADKYPTLSECAAAIRARIK